MREPAFLRRNKDKWLEYERSLFSGTASQIDPDRLAKLYIQLTDDLAYARTFYPKSQIVRYLNGLAARTHLLIYKNKKTQQHRLLSFWTEELPSIMYQSRRSMLYSLVLFLFTVLIGFLVSQHDDTLLRSILGDGYVNMSLDNIEAGKPTAVYQGGSALESFILIARNNIWIAFWAFAAGIFIGIGTLYVLLFNGLMVGAFLGMFYAYNVSASAWPVVFIHGTFELFSVVVAAGAGIMLGNSILFPGTYRRIESLRAAAKKGIKILVGLVPFFLFAAWLESYITRYTDMALWIKLAIILLSLGTILVYFVWYPYYLHKKQPLPKPKVLHT